MAASVSEMVAERSAVGTAQLADFLHVGALDVGLQFVDEALRVTELLKQSDEGFEVALLRGVDEGGGCGGVIHSGWFWFLTESVFAVADEGGGPDGEAEDSGEQYFDFFFSRHLGWQFVLRRSRCSSRTFISRSAFRDSRASMLVASSARSFCTRTRTSSRKPITHRRMMMTVVTLIGRSSRRKRRATLLARQR
jgi:hypothetical protein